MIKTHLLLSKKNKKKKKIFRYGVVHVKTTYRNCIVTFCDIFGNVISFSSAGIQGFRGKKKGTYLAALAAARTAAEKAINQGIRSIDLIVHGRGKGRSSSLKAFKALGLSITSVAQKISVPHNGCRASKRRKL